MILVSQSCFLFTIKEIGGITYLIIWTMGWTIYNLSFSKKL